MLRQAFLLAFRNLRRQRLYSAVIILSLALALAMANLLTAFIVRESRTDAFHEKADRLYRLISADPMKAEGHISYILDAASEYLGDRYPEVAGLCRVADLDEAGVRLRGERGTLDEQGVLAVDSSFFHLFDFPLRSGDGASALRPGQIVLTGDVARRLFGDADAVGKTVGVRRDSVEKRLTVSAVIARLPQNSHLRFDALVSRAEFGDAPPGATVYVLLHPGAGATAAGRKLAADPELPSLSGPGRGGYSLQPLAAVYFDESQTRTYLQTRSRLLVSMAWAVVFLIILIAGFNFLNLIALSLLGRRLAVGIQRVFGAGAAHLRVTAMAEVATILLIAGGLSLAAVPALLPAFNRAFDAGLDAAYLSRADVLAPFAGLVLAAAIVFVLFLSGRLIRLEPVRLIGGREAPRLTVNRWLFSAQFAVSIALIIATVAIVRQVRLIERKPLGFHRHLLELKAPEGREHRLAVLLEDLRRRPGLERAALASGSPLTGRWKAQYALANGEPFVPSLFWGDETLGRVLGLDLVAGRWYDPALPNGRVVNEALVRRFGWRDPVGRRIPGALGNDRAPLVVTGVVRDFHVGSLREAIPPVMLGYQAAPPALLLHYDERRLAALLPQVAAAWRRVFPETPFRYRLTGDELYRIHAADFQFFRIIIAFAAASVFITGFGLFALAWATTRARAREIGIRKVLGASPRRIFAMLVLDYSRWIALGAVAAVPVAGYLVRRWLEHFAYRIPLDGWTFLLAGGLLAALVLLSVGIQTLRSARLDPAAELRQ